MQDSLNLFSNTLSSNGYFAARQDGYRLIIKSRKRDKQRNCLYFEYIINRPSKLIRIKQWNTHQEGTENEYRNCVEAEWSLIAAGRTTRGLGKYSLFRGFCTEGGPGNYMTS